MNLDDILYRYFATTDPSALPPQVQAAGIERILVDFGLEQDSGKRFALWSVLLMFAAAPDPESAFEDPQDREAARNLMELLGVDRK